MPKIEIRKSNLAGHGRSSGIELGLERRKSPVKDESRVSNFEFRILRLLTPES